MSIIRASKTFEGGELTNKASTYLKSGTQLVDFKNKADGVYLFILGAYKADRAGNGVWYRPFEVRDNFGMGMYKEKFASQDNCPIKYFSNKVQTFAPDMAKVTKVKDDTGRDRLVYPVWGRIQWRVLYNVALFGDYGSGVHVLDLPMNGGGAIIDDYVHGKQANGEENPSITDYESAVPVNIKLDLKAGGMPWKIRVDSGKTYKLPTQLADTDYLYNLDDVINYPDKEQLIEKLRSVVPTDVFEKGLEGYSITGNTMVSMAIPRTGAPAIPTQEEAAPEVPSKVTEDDVPMTYENPIEIPKPRKGVAPTIAIPKSNVPKPTDGAESFTPPASNSAALAAAALYLTKH